MQIWKMQPVNAGLWLASRHLEVICRPDGALVKYFISLEKKLYEHTTGVWIMGIDLLFLIFNI
jgi:hypothetical protein